MRRAGYLLVGAAFMCALGYVAWFNPDTVELRLGKDWSVRAPLAAQLIFAFLAGATVVLIGNAVREGRRAVARWRQQRRTRRQLRVTALADSGRAALWGGETDGARGLLRRAWKFQPTRGTLLTLAEASVTADDLQEARRVLQAATPDLADDPEVLCALANVCRHMGDTAGAIAALERARRHFPRAPRVLREMRDLYIDAERWSEAAAVHGEWMGVRAKATSTSSSDQITLAGTRYQAALRIPGREARVRALEDLVGRFPRFLPAAVSLGDELVTAGKTGEAIRLWEYTFRQQPRAILAERLASVANDRRTRGRLSTCLHKLRGSQIDQDAICIWLARLCTEDGQLDAAQQEIEGVGPTKQATPAFQRTLAQLNERRGHVDQALAAYHRATEGTTVYRCAACGRTAPAWRAFCAPCRRWDTWRSEVEIVRE